VGARVVLLNGADAGERPLHALAGRVEGELVAQGAQVVRHDLAGETVAFCQGCFECWVKTPGLCKANDGGRAIAEDVINGDVLLLITRVAFGGYGPTLKKALDRMTPLVLPFFTSAAGKTCHQKRYARYPAIVAVGQLTSADPEQRRIFTELVARNARDLHAPTQHAEVLEPGAASAGDIPSIVLGLAGLAGGVP
jgi:multimeric flavodoxin WrbA